MVKIDGTSELIAALRSQIASRAEKSRGSGTPATEGSRVDATPPPVVTIEQLQQRIGRELHELDLKVPANRRRARLIFIESVLTRDFGDALLNDPRFGFLVRDIEESMIAHPDIAGELDQMLEQMHGR